MARPRSNFSLFDGQFEALQLPDPEILLTSARPGIPAGASYLLRAWAIRSCAHRAGGTSVFLLQRNQVELERDHVKAPEGILAMIREMEAHGFATISAAQDEVRFKNGSVLRWGGCAREAEVSRLNERRIDVLLVDKADEVPEALFSRLSTQVLASPHPARRVVAASRSAAVADGWPGRHWGLLSVPGRRVVQLDPEDLDPDLIEVERGMSYEEWLEKRFAGEFKWAPYTRAIVRGIDRWMNEEFDHFGVFIPSQHGKTTAGPGHAVAYIGERFPTDWSAIISYTAEVANSRSADARENYLKAGGQLRGGRNKVKQWLNAAGGGCWSSGMGAGGTGHPNTWLFFDDPDQDWEDAVNRLKQTKKRRRYGGVFRARESMFAGGGRRQKICATVTRWDPEDLIGHAMKTSHEALAAEASASEKWGILVLPALYDPEIAEGYRQLYPLFTVLDDFRSEPGEPLWPERRSAKDWRIVFTIRGPIIAACECQQNPKGVEKGGNFESSWFRRRYRDPAYLTELAHEEVYAACVRAWDLASTEGGGDYTVGAKVGRLAEGGDIVVRHVVRAQFASRGVKQLIAAAMIVDGPRVKIRLPIDPAAGGQSWADEIVRYLREVAGWVGMPVPTIVAKRPRRAATATMAAKAARAEAFKSRAMPPEKGMEGGVSFVGSPWSPALSNMVSDWSIRLAAHPELAEIAAKAALFSDPWWNFWLQILESFTGDDGRIDDDVDATVDGYEEVYEEPPSVAISGSMAIPPGW